ncbi:hypothetical protein N7481_003769 [Penicillium waksmanii]|uniref:uncharacterized protein n=1 Tax=Penicillium waksmanii TaxID=69791 RepID=UPI002546ACCA|nr:uncharacterized protein N7481_003769 [Penicillium waksmanii]KAJ5988559.1 hypothetical protein N7481_003769 [Penicillium waksmanii]
MAQLNAAPRLREQLLQPEKNSTDARLKQLIRSRPSNIDFEKIQAVSRIPAQECTCCQAGKGPWNICVIFQPDPKASPATKCAK